MCSSMQKRELERRYDCDVENEIEIGNYRTMHAQNTVVIYYLFAFCSCMVTVSAHALLKGLNYSLHRNCTGLNIINQKRR